MNVRTSGRAKASAARIPPVDLAPMDSVIRNIYSAIQRAYDYNQVDQTFYDLYCQDVARASVQFGWAEEMRQPEDIREPL